MKPTPIASHKQTELFYEADVPIPGDLVEDRKTELKTLIAALLVKLFDNPAGRKGGECDD